MSFGKTLLYGKTRIANRTLAEGQTSVLALDAAGLLRVATHAVTGSGNFTITPAAGTGYALTSTASTNAANFRSTPATLSEVAAFNPTAATVYVKLYNKATAPTLASDVPVLVIPLAPNQGASLEFGPIGKRFSNGISIAITAGPLNTDAVAVGAGVSFSATHI